jgi:hypothetical protein
MTLRNGILTLKRINGIDVLIDVKKIKKMRQNLKSTILTVKDEFGTETFNILETKEQIEKLLGGANG